MGACHSSGEPFLCAPSVPLSPPRKHRPGCAAEILIRSAAVPQQRRSTGAVPLFRCYPAGHVPSSAVRAARAALACMCLLSGFCCARSARLQCVAWFWEGFWAARARPPRARWRRCWGAVVCKMGRSRPLWIVAVRQEAQLSRLGWACRTTAFGVHILCGA